MNLQLKPKQNSRKTGCIQTDYVDEYWLLPHSMPVFQVFQGQMADIPALEPLRGGSPVPGEK